MKLKKIAHISDLHFGTEKQKIADGLVVDLHALQPDLVVVSGDLTQRARSGQFKAARDFLKKLPQPQLTVPGNHDVPLYDIFRRFLMPLKRYRKYISDDLAPLYRDEEMAVYGLNSARSFTWKEGRISIEQIQAMEETLCAIPNKLFKAVVTHHPFIPPPEDEGIRLVGRSKKALKIIAKCGIDLLLSGHLHQGYSGDVRPYYPETQKSIIVAQAGTAISRRIREKGNAYNFISVNRKNIIIAAREWNGSRFQEAIVSRYIKDEEEWKIQHAKERVPNAKQVYRQT